MENETQAIARGSVDFQYEGEKIQQLIKVVGVGGGGGNAVTKMYTSGSVPGVSFLLCNTDVQALNTSSVPDKIMIGPNETKGLGAGAKPERARAAAVESTEEIRAALADGQTRMVFITAGMGGGTGTGAAPVIGKVAMEEGLLTIGIVTIPFLFEGTSKIIQALEGVKEMRKHVDALLVINNQRLIEVYQDLSVVDAFAKADETLSNAARGISDIVNIAGTVNLDFADVDTTLRNGGVAVINTGYASGPDRMTQAIQNALNSPLLNNNNITKARQLLINVYDSPESRMSVREFQEIQSFTADFSNEVNTIYGTAQRDDLGDQLAVTILASGFGLDEDVFLPSPTRREDRLSRITEDRERDEQQRLIERVYGGAAIRRPKAEPVALSIKELDDEELIQIIEETASIHRDHRIFDTKRNERAPQRPIHIASQGAGYGTTTSRREEREATIHTEPHPQRQEDDYDSPREAEGDNVIHFSGF